MKDQHLLIGETLAFADDPFLNHISEVVHYNESGAVVVEAGKIAAVGNAAELRKAFPQAAEHDYGRCLITAGFIDSHAHYPQTAIIASWGSRLIDWLNNFTFPEEAKFKSPEYAESVARRYLEIILANGTTTVCSFCTSHPVSVTALFSEASKLSMRVAAGKTCMDRNAPQELLDSAVSAHAESERLIGQWHGKGRCSYVISPRFAPTSTPAQLEAMGSLWANHPSCLMQTHISEQPEEVAWVRELFPDCGDYLDVYDNFGLLGCRGLYGHGIHLGRQELDRLREVGGSIIHCPTSNLFIGSGLLEVMERKAGGIPVGLATDTGGGSSFSMLRTMAAAYEISQLLGTPLHPAQLYWLATMGNAQAMHMSDRIGNLQTGMEADLVVLDLESTSAISTAAQRAEDVWQRLFPTIMLGDDRAIADVWVNGNRSATPA